MNKYPNRLRVVFALILKSALIVSIGASLASCGKEGPFGNNQGPKKPAWSYDSNGLN